MDSTAGTDTLTYNAASMLLTKNGNGYTNDANGNTLTGGGRPFTWDGQNRLTQCVNNGTTTTHTYGSDGLRRRTVQGSTTTDFVLDVSSVVRTLTNGVLDRTFLHGTRGPEYERIGANAPGWYAYDGLGSVLGIVDAGGNLTSVRKYDVYGGVRGLTGQSGSKHKWVGQLGHLSEDETGLVYMRARYYDPVGGRFVSEDPAKDGGNWFGYCRANPINFADSNGCEAKNMGLLQRWAYRNGGYLVMIAVVLAFSGTPAGKLAAISCAVLSVALIGVAGSATFSDGFDVASAMLALGGEVLNTIAAIIELVDQTKGLTRRVPAGMVAVGFAVAYFLVATGWLNADGYDNLWWM